MTRLAAGMSSPLSVAWLDLPRISNGFEPFARAERAPTPLITTRVCVESVLAHRFGTSVGVDNAPGVW